MRPLPWLLADVALWSVAFAACLGLLVLVRNGSSLPNSSVFVIPCAMSLLAGWLVGAYDRDTDFVSLRFASESLIAGLAATALGAGGVALFGSYGLPGQPSRFLLMAAPMVFTGLSVMARRRLLGSFLESQRLRLVLIGAPRDQERLEAGLRLAGRGYSLARLDPTNLNRAALESSLQGDAPAEADPTYSSLALVLGPDAAERLGKLTPVLASLHASGVPVYSWQSFWMQRLRMLDLSDNPTHWLFERDFRHLHHSAFWQLKRLLDIVVAVTSLIVTAPLCAIVWMAIRLDSQGPAFFRQPRVGLRGREFSICKFRTMRLHSEKAGSTTTLDDPRITRLGHFLRRTRIDEIPQLLNVLRGEMSLVGPRPEWTVCVAEYEEQLPGYHLRHLAKPGLTGWAQVNYPYGAGLEDAACKLAFDLHYVTHASLVLDCSILLKTLYVVFGRIGGR
jgi:exopolysaccharide biosynthesis polyprenyl glycosylphosphotransferase